MSNVFSRLDDDEEEFEGDHFTVQVGTETAVVELQDGMSIRDAFVSQADVLGFDFGKRLTYTDARGRSVDPSTSPVANALYRANVQHESKG